MPALYRCIITCLLAVLLLGALSACGNESSSASSQNTLVVAIQSGGNTLDPHQATTAAKQHLVENIYAGLMRYSEDYPNVEKDLLADYTINEDFTIFEFTLKEGLRFHSGNALTADDVKFSFNRLKSLGNSEPLKKLDRIEVTDETHLALHFTEPMSPLLTYLAKPTHAIVDQSVVEAHDGDIDKVDTGAGPFRLTEWKQGQRLELKAFDDYHVPDQPHVQRVVYQPISDPTARAIALANDEVHIVLDVPLAAVERLKQTGGVTVETAPGTFWEYIGLNTAKPPFDDPRVRRAVAWAIDREAINTSVKMGKATVLTGSPIPPHHWAHANADMYGEQRIERAKKLLAEAGYADGASAELIVGVDFRYQIKAAEMIKQMLKPVGIDITLNHMESTAYFGRLNNGNFQMTVVGFVGMADPDEWFAKVYHSQGKYNQQNYGNAEVDRLIAEGRTVRDRGQRAAIYARLQQIIAQDAPTIPLYVTPRIAAYRDRVEGFDVHPTATTISLRNTRLAE